MLKFQNQRADFESVGSPNSRPKYPMMNNQMQQQRPSSSQQSASGYSHLQETFGPAPSRQPQQGQQQQMGKQASSLSSYQKQMQQQYQEAQAKLQQQQQPNQQQFKVQSQNQSQPLKSSAFLKQQQQQQLQQVGMRIQSSSGDNSILQNKTNLMNNNNNYYMSNGQGKLPSNQEQRQATPLKDMKQQFKVNPKMQSPDVNMYSPVPRANNNEVVYQQQPNVVQTRSPQMQRVGSSSNNNLGNAFGGVPSNVQQLLDELNGEKEKNRQLVTKLRKLELEQRSHSTLFLNDLERRIKLLIQQNDQLQTKNTELNNKIQNDKTTQNQFEEFNKQLQHCQQQLDQVNRQFQECSSELSQYKIRCNELEQQIMEAEEGEETQIRMLVGDLEEKVHGLIQENERLNQSIQCDNPRKEQLYQLQNEKGKLLKMIQTNAKELEAWKTKFEQLTQKMKNNDNVSHNENDLEYYNEQVEDLENKIRLLIEENDNLNNKVQDQIQKETYVAQLEDEMQSLVEQNDNLEQDLNKLTNKG